MKALLIYPGIPLTYWGFQYALELIGRKAFMPPLGLLTVAALCPPDWDLQLIDLNVESLCTDHLKWADLALVSGMLVQHKSMIDILARCKQAGVTTVVGGPYATSTPERLPDADYLVLDEAEITLPLFLRDYAAGCAQRIYRADGEKPDITRTPSPRFDLLKIERYGDMCVQFSRGCPFACEFCDITALYGRIPRTKAPAQLISELESIYELGFRGPVFLVDDNFIGDKHKIKLLLRDLIPWMKKYDYPFWLYTEASIDLANDDELLALMVEAGFVFVFVGIESPSEESLRETHKYQNLRGDLISRVHKIQEAGLEVFGGFIIGFDNDDESIFERQLEFINASRIPVAMVGTLQALPNTKLWDRLQREDRLLSKGGGDNYEIPNFRTKLPTTRLISGYRDLLASLYSPGSYFDRLYELCTVIKFRRNLLPGGLTLSRKASLAYRLGKAALAIGFGLEWRFQNEYWGFLLKVWRNHPENFLFALVRSIAGYHCIRYTSKIIVPRLTKLEAEMHGAMKE